MKKIRFLRSFVSAERVAISGPDILSLLPSDNPERRNLVIRKEESKFLPNEELEVQPLTVENRHLIVVGNLDQRLAAVLDGAVEGADFEYVK